MMLSFKTPDGPKSLQETGMEPPSAGEFLGASIKRRHLDPSVVAEKTGLGRANLEAIIENITPVDRKVSKKLDKVFPGIGKLLIRIQEHKRFFDKHGVIRPRSPLRRAIAIRNARLRSGQKLQR